MCGYMSEQVGEGFLKWARLNKSMCGYMGTHSVDKMTDKHDWRLNMYFQKLRWLMVKIMYFFYMRDTSLEIALILLPEH